MKSTVEAINEYIAAMRGKDQGFSFGDPWRLDDTCLSVVIPIIRKTDKERAYKILAECERVRLFDTGGIGGIKIENGEDKPVFIRHGEILKGITQERGVVHSIIVMPHTAEIMKVRCVHATRGIHGNAAMTSAGYVPRGLEEVLLEADQHHVWSTINVECIADMRAAHAYCKRGYGSRERVEELKTVPSDDLSSRCHKYGEFMDEILKNVPLAQGQVGMAIISRRGFDALEVFDVPATWKVLRDTVMKTAGVTMADFDDDGVFTYQPKKATESVIKALGATFQTNTIYVKDTVSVVRLQSESLLGEATLLDGEVVHLRLFRRIKNRYYDEGPDPYFGTPDITM